MPASSLPDRPLPVSGDPARGEVYRAPQDVGALVADHAEGFDRVDDADPGSGPGQALGPILDRIGDAHVVCIGEASHGTHEFYRLRARITQALIEEKAFSVVGAEADWPDMERIDAYVRWRQPDDSEWEAFALLSRSGLRVAERPGLGARRAGGAVHRAPRSLAETASAAPPDQGRLGRTAPPRAFPTRRSYTCAHHTSTSTSVRATDVRLAWIGPPALA
ncbi:erythromycin esterase family protein [Rubricoccus marinus]|uniref:Erythromycin esterase n=1 Tax=Rubricoccus marinus TaxID=716817 RepID=A0A259TUI4_9BACT|nr:erythromycin esterase family protein [Rubricoccus marinus]OZC01218.1 hypothetical protein BSZ36_18365 [Rubricoccus marinus]